MSSGDAEQAGVGIIDSPGGRAVTCQGICSLHKHFHLECNEVDLPEEIRTRVVPVSTMPAVLDRIEVEAPYRIDWLIPQNSLAGNVVVMGLDIEYQLPYTRL